MERSSSGQEPTHQPHWEEVARRKPSERQVDMVFCAGAAARGAERGLNFIVWNFTWDRLASRLYAATATPSVPYMKIPANNQVIFMMPTLLFSNQFMCVHHLY